jgi:hypothetical protein
VRQRALGAAAALLAGVAVGLPWRGRGTLLGGGGRQRLRNLILAFSSLEADDDDEISHRCAVAAVEPLLCVDRALQHTYLR